MSDFLQGLLGRRRIFAADFFVQGLSVKGTLGRLAVIVLRRRFSPFTVGHDRFKGLIQFGGLAGADDDLPFVA